VFLALFAWALAAAPSAFASDVDVAWANVGHYKDHLDGVPLDQTEYAVGPWGITLELGGTGVNNVSVLSPSGVSVSLEATGPNSWGFSEDFSSKSATFLKYPSGLYRFSINSGAVTLNVTEDNAEPLGLADILSPSHASAGVSLTPTFSWSPCAGLGEALSYYVEDDQTGQRFLPQDFSDIGATSWKYQPSLESDVLLQSHEYWFGIDVTNYSLSTSTTSAGDEFQALSQFLYFNQISFSTVPEPATLSLLAVGGLLALRRRR
jgi:hypothetical protein